MYHGSHHKNIKCQIMSGINFLCVGWIELHNSAMIFGAEVDYWPPDYPELKNRRFLDAQLYSDLLPRLVKYPRNAYPVTHGSVGSLFTPYFNDFQSCQSGNIV